MEIHRLRVIFDDTVMIDTLIAGGEIEHRTKSCGDCPPTYEISLIAEALEPVSEVTPGA